MKTMVDSIRLLLANGDASELFHSLSAELDRVVLVAACLRGSALLRADGRAHLIKDEGERVSHARDVQPTGSNVA